MNTIRLQVSIDDQQLSVFDGDRLLRSYPISSAAKGVGFVPESFRTPTGRFVVVEKIGDDAPPGTIFRQRRPVGLWTPDQPTEEDLVLTRILRISGLDPENANTFDRYIYFHGTNREDLLGQPSSHGCIRLANDSMMELYDLVRPGTLITIEPPVRRRGKLIFFDCDSTLSSIEGIDELARTCSPEIFSEVEELTHQAMNGEVPIHEVFGRRIEIIRPTREQAAAVAQRYLETVVPGARETISLLQSQDWTVVILSGGFAPIIEPLARFLCISFIEAVPLYFHEDGSYAGYGADYPTTRNGGKPEIVREWKKALLPEKVLMVGDGVSDLEARTEVDTFIGFGGVVARPAVQQQADLWLDNMSEFGNLVKI